jgi:hypothetical protein
VEPNQQQDGPGLTPTRRGWQGLLAAASALVFGWAAHTLPWRAGTPLGLVMWALCLLHAATLVSLGFWPARALRLWRALGAASLASALLFTLAIAASAYRMVQLYGALGWNLTLLLSLIWLLLMTATVPVAAWGLGQSRSRPEHR